VFTTSLFFKKNIYLFVGLILFIFSLLSILRGNNYSVWWFLMDPIILEFYLGMIIGYCILKNKYIPTFLSIILLSLSLLYLFFSSNILNLPRILENGVPASILVWSILSLEIYIQNKIPRIVMFFGAASYALYLFHPLIAPLAPVVLKKLEIISLPISIMFSVTLAMIVSAIIHHWFEQPLISILRKDNHLSVIKYI
jgi:peptidoglycan/LPS O-acetylase OafA/YrhL